MTEQPFADIPPWPPTRWTPPLSDDFPSAFDGYRDLLRVVWLAAFGYVLEVWQESALRLIFEIYPEGHARAGELRWRRVIVSLGRQNGKTEIAAAIGLVVLLMKVAPTIVGIATRADQAKLIYERTMQAIKATPALARKFKALTDTRGIRSVSGGNYTIKPSRSTALQGIPIDLALVDELHILPRALWTDLNKGLGGRANCLVVGITTAGNDESELLLSLYEAGERAIAAGDETRTCFLVWEAPEARRPPDTETLSRYLAYANPAIASGRRDLETELDDIADEPHPDTIRYGLNRFTASTNVFIPVDAWARGITLDGWPAGARPVFAIDRTPDWAYASVAAFTLLPDGSTYCELVASLSSPTQAKLAEVAMMLSRHNPVTFAMDRWPLGDLARDLQARGLPVTLATTADILNGSALFYSKVLAGKIKHNGNPLLAFQVPRTVRKDVNDGFRISRTDSSVEIDAVMAHVIGVHVAETRREVPFQLF